MNPAEHRLAQAVEDHPFDYRDFEGVIPKGYGAGTVMVWDTGSYEPLQKKKTKAEREHLLLSQYYKGAMSMRLNGKKLKGAFTLVHTPERAENAWLLTKMADNHASKKDVAEKDKSVLSGKTLEEIAADPSRVWHSDRENRDFAAIAKDKGRKAKMPASVEPMLCTLTREPIDSEQYLHEIKWDGYRIIGYAHKGKVTLDSRSALDYTAKYPPVVAAMKQLGHDVVLDGEVVVFNEEGLPDFDALQKYNGHDSPINYCVFDILWLDGYDVSDLPLIERKDILKGLLSGQEVLKYSASFDDGPALYEQALERGLEGIVSKRKDIPYQQGVRNNNWLKTPTRKRQEFVIGGWAESDKARSFRSLLFGAYNGQGDFEWIGRSGGGFKEKEMPAILAQLRKIEIDRSPFVNKVLDTKGATLHWVKPLLVANFEFATWTKSGRIRKPATFIAFRQDKKPEEVVREIPLSEKKEQQLEEETNEDAKLHETEISKPTQRAALSPLSNWRKIYERKISSEQEFKIGGHTVLLSNVEHELWKDVPKAELITYYHNVSSYMLPYLKNRPLSVHIKDMPTVEGYYIKDMEGQQPEYVDIFRDKRRVPKKGKRAIIDYGVCNNEAALLYFINLGCIDMNPWSATVAHPDEPDYISIDLDPTDDDFSKIVQTALAVKQVLDRQKLRAVIKTSGKRGLHIFIPCSGFKNGEVKALGRVIYEETHELLPDITTDIVSKSQRKGRVYIDYTLNDYADTLACVYSVRPYHIPSVSTPLDWAEVQKGLHPADFTIDTIMARLEAKGDLFQDLFNEGWRKSNNRILKKMLASVA